MFEIIYNAVLFIGGFIGGIILMMYRYRDYIKLGLESLIEAWKDGVIDLFDAVYLIVKVYSYVNGVSEQKGALEIINEIKKRFGLEG